MSKSLEAAKKIKAAAVELGWQLEIRGNILTITKKIRPGCKESFCQADMEYYDILGHLPTTEPGSIWGTDGGGIGAMSAMNSGLMKMHKSGGSKRVLNALQKIL
jgi:hypothetical protein